MTNGQHQPARSDADRAALRDRIVAEGRRLGFAVVGIAPAGPSATHAEFMRWLESGRAAELHYLARHAPMRADPRGLMADARTILVCGVRYPVNPRPGSGFSTYAQGLDYHDVVREKLLRLTQELRMHIGPFHARASCDSARLAEREWAVRAGAGWIGRQGQLVHPRYGCCLVLGVLVTDLDAAPTPPQSDRCGRCRRCVDSCPTGALGPDRHVDCRRCISYLTIEHKGEIPLEIRPQMGGAVFGCDLCTAICPWNRFGAETVLPQLLAQPVPSAADCLAMTDAEFESRFRHTAVWRLGLERLKRNSAIALGNERPPNAHAVLRRALSDPSPLVRDHAAWALRRISG